MTSFNPYPFNEDQIRFRVDELTVASTGLPSRETMIQILSIVDLTTLEGTDNEARISAICDKAKRLQSIADDIPGVAAVCFYPPFVRQARQELEGTGIHVASVAGAFPSGQSSLAVKVEEVKFAVGEGADEIDTVISRGRMLAGDYSFVSDEVAAIKEACGEAHLKVILETGELQSVELIRKASEIAIEAGADFIKTSTGKVQPAATPEAFYIMADTIREYHARTGNKVGIKPAGGISTPEQALIYRNILLELLGNEWLNKKLFRIGASRLTDALVHTIA